MQSVRISLTATEVSYLLELVFSDRRRMVELRDHALSHGTKSFTPQHWAQCESVLDRISASTSQVTVPAPAQPHDFK
jgi:hypothetical protein